ncbi:MAG: flagellar hook-basal body complex protein, partial [Sphingomonadales bacterium]|nr:flagellar hook-basal body complex protein [Sphingomonadales bacterium]
VAPLINGQLAVGTLAFNTDGSLDYAGTTAALINSMPANWTTGASASTLTFNLGSDGATDGFTQFDSVSTLISSNVNGAVFGNVTGVDIGKDGIVTALFDNGLSQAVFQLPVATFQNPDGLGRRQGNAYGVSDASGNFSLVEAGTGGGGTIAPSTLEASTVDLAKEFTELITVQRAFSASTRIITTADEMLDELNRVKR